VKSLLRITSVVLLCALTLTACASSGSGAVTVQLDEFSLDPSASQAAAGPVHFEISNLGAVAHEFVVLRTSRPADKLPVKNGLVRVTMRGISVVKTIKRIKPSDLRSVTVTLRPGRYALICNIVGHYQSGMHAPFRIT
jgi:uncharacterized cupredoxin-like copper-binding protein